MSPERENMGTEEDIKTLKNNFQEAHEWRVKFNGELLEVKESVKRIELAIGGDSQLGINGLLHVINKLCVDLEKMNKNMGDIVSKSDAKTTIELNKFREESEIIKARINKLEDGQKKIFFISAGIGIGIAFVTDWLGKLIGLFTGAKP